MKIIFRNIILLLFLISSDLLYAENPIERRVYYLDCSYSMITNNLFDSVREDLKKAIQDITDQRTEILVIPFAVNGSSDYKTLKPIEGKANDKEKELICSKIDNLKPNKSSMTYHHLTLDDFYNNKRWKDSKYVTYMFVMTDGKDEDKSQKFVKLLDKWNTVGTNTYGFYVKLIPDAEYPEAERQINRLNNFFIIDSAKINLNFIRLKKSVVFNARNERLCKIRIESGNIDVNKLRITSSDNKYYRISSNPSKSDDFIQIAIEPNKGEKPDKYDLYLDLNYNSSNSNNTNILVTKRIKVECRFEKEPALNKIQIK